MNLARVSGMLLGGAAATLLLAGCGSGDAAAGEVREVLVDYVHDEVAASFLLYFPRDVVVRPGDTVRFKQHWTGEPHSVTMGTIVDDLLGQAIPIVEEHRGKPFEEIPPEDFELVNSLFGELPPFMLPESAEGGPINQNVGQPCFLEEGGPPEDSMTPCTDEQQEQPPFDGTQSFYNSGFIPYEGPRGNTFEVPLADDIAPGTYYYYCNVHGPLQYGTINVVEVGEPIPSQADVSRQALAEIDEVAEVLLDAHRTAQDNAKATVFAQTVEKPYAGFGVDDRWTHAFLDEFYPREITVTAGQAVTWDFVGAHTVSFNVPDYFSQLTVEDDGTVIFSADALEPRGGPGMPPSPEGGPPGDGPPGEGEGEGPPPEPPAVDAGEWDGDRFLSSGLFFAGSYTVTFTEPGTYEYACLVHPYMIGSVTVEPGG